MRDAWRLATPYFRSEEAASAWGLLGAIVALNFCLTGLDLLLNRWNGAIYDALQQRDGAAFAALALLGHRASGVMTPGWVAITLPYIGCTVLEAYLLQWLQIRWRRWMTGRFLADWLRLGTDTTGLDNPDQRIAEDLNSFCGASLSLGIDLLANLISLGSFIVVLWQLSGDGRVLGHVVHGYMVWVALLYALVASLLTHLVGRRLVRLDFLHERFEANFRFSLMRVRVAPESPDAAALELRFADIVANWRALMRRRAWLGVMTNFVGQAEGLFPLVVAAPRYFAGSLSLGGLLRMTSAFAQVARALSWFVTSYASLAAWAATVNRLADFERGARGKEG